MFEPLRPHTLCQPGTNRAQESVLPEFRLRTVTGENWASHDAEAGMRLLLIYRGVHSDACRLRVQELARLAMRLQQWGVAPVAASVDPRIRAEAAHCLWKLDDLRGNGPLALAYGLPLDVALQCALQFGPGRGRAGNGWMEPPLYATPGVFLVHNSGRVVAALRDEYRLDRSPLLELMPALPLLVRQERRGLVVQ
jgi:peroxiredoxin